MIAKILLICGIFELILAVSITYAQGPNSDVGLKAEQGTFETAEEYGAVVCMSWLDNKELSQNELVNKVDKLAKEKVIGHFFNGVDNGKSKINKREFYPPPESTVCSSAIVLK